MYNKPDMCGRYTQTVELEKLLDRFKLPQPAFPVPKRYNLAPGQEAPVVTQEKSRLLRLLRWGFLPPWKKEEPNLRPLINARAETLEQRSSFRTPLRQRRCLVPADGFYEWAPLGVGRSKIPILFLLKTREPFAFRAASGNDTTIELAFTPADFLCCDRRLANQFWDVPAEHWHEQMTPLQDYLALDRETARTGIPYLLTVDEEGLIHRVAVTRAVVAIVLQCLAAWRHLQEVGGINNSYTAHQVALEKARLEAEQQAAIKSLEEQYSRQLDQDLGQLTEEIVQRIAQQLVQAVRLGSPQAATGVVEAATGVTARVARPAAKEAAPADAAEPAAAPTKTPAALDDDEGEAVNLDAAYIETPRCTTCDECTKLNPLIFVYDSNKQAYIKDAAAGPYKDIVKAAEKCPVKIIHPGKPLNPAEPHLEDLIKRAEPFM